MFSKLLRGQAGNLPEVPVKAGKGGKACPPCNGIDEIISPCQLIAGAADPDKIDIFNRGHFHILQENPSEMCFADMAHSGKFFYLERVSAR